MLSACDKPGGNRVANIDLRIEQSKDTHQLSEDTHRVVHHLVGVSDHHHLVGVSDHRLVWLDISL